MNLKHLFRRAPLSSSTPARPLPFSRLTLDDWRSSPERVAYVAELLRAPLFLDLLGMLSNVRPLHRGPVDKTTAALLLGQRIGHDQIIATLLDAGKQVASAPQEIVADYGAENVQALWEKEGDMTDQT